MTQQEFQLVSRLTRALEGISTSLEKLVKQTEEKKAVKPECPFCQEDDIDKLEWLNDVTVRCHSCQRDFYPPKS